MTAGNPQSWESLGSDPAAEAKTRTIVVGSRCSDVLRHLKCAPEGIRTPNLLIRSQMLYPLSYGRLGIACNLVQPTGLAIPAPN